MERDRNTSEHIDYLLEPPKVSGVIFLPVEEGNWEGEWDEVKLPTSEKDAIEIEVEDGTFVDVYGGGKKFTFRVRYEEGGKEKKTRWIDSSFSPITRINKNNEESPFFWQVHKEYGLHWRYSASAVWNSKGNLR